MKAAFFDLERTLTPHAVEQVAATAMWRRGMLRTRYLLKVAWIYLRYDLGFLEGFESLKGEGAVLFAGREADRDRKLFEDFFDERLKKDIYPQARELVARFTAEGTDLYIVSSTYDFMVAPYARELGMKDYFAVQREVEDGMCTGRLTGRIPHRHLKAEVVRELAAEHGYDLAECWAFGDSTNDLPMLEAVGHPRPVNPNRKLRKAAVERGWEILDWTL